MKALTSIQWKSTRYDNGAHNTELAYMQLGPEMSVRRAAEAGLGISIIGYKRSELTGQLALVAIKDSEQSIASLQSRLTLGKKA